ncbi:MULTISPECIES: heterocyst-inhibiting protein PatX [Fischerella]|jgi:hypothetical protein|uniref:Uncharacterized protein n=1 Tax=Fischerella muscicola CCMEE 5323 TaxID=2019572 RepID=A0A2N6JUY2_FISMU|nr:MULTISPECIES: hypothetical protein [Fischerella]MBD2433418.1 hypothetical protein [Fischerella sp. FACHB-380]PLZ82367.1 hypothetical protein CEN44_27750 [Fischerella muscicola CCMEE 5323]
MRAAISLLVTGLLLSSLAANSQTVTNSLSNMLQSHSSSHLLISAKSKQPKSPYRGSGRDRDRERVSYLLLSSKANPPKNRPAKGGSRRDLMEHPGKKHVVV